MRISVLIEEEDLALFKTKLIGKKESMSPLIRKWIKKYTEQSSTGPIQTNDTPQVLDYLTVDIEKIEQNTQSLKLNPTIEDLKLKLSTKKTKSKSSYCPHFITKGGKCKYCPNGLAI